MSAVVLRRNVVIVVAVSASGIGVVGKVQKVEEKSIKRRNITLVLLLVSDIDLSGEGAGSEERKSETARDIMMGHILHKNFGTHTFDVAALASGVYPVIYTLACGVPPYLQFSEQSA